MIEEWAYLAKKYNIAGARIRFEDICASLFKKKFRDRNVKTVRVTAGDGGIDIFIGDLGISPVEVFQCKFFPQGIEASQKQQIRESFRAVMEATDYDCSSWTLCMPEELSKAEHRWWAEWKEKQTTKYRLEKDYIQLVDGADILDGLKEHGLYDDVFDEDIKLGIAKLMKSVGPRDFDLEAELTRGSLFFNGIKNYFSDYTECHIDRKEAKDIVDWTTAELRGKDRLERVMVVKGKKGMGKSTILRDAYFSLKEMDLHCVLAIKCDQFYDVNLDDLAKQLFTNGISFDDILSKAASTEKRIVVFLDQLDALSQTLSADRRWLQTYVMLIDRLLEQRNVRIILSTRTFDLDYDADLRRFSDQNLVRQIEVGNLTKEEIETALKILGITVKNKVLLELLSVPYNMELFTMIPDLGNLLKKDTEISVSRLHTELRIQVLQERNLKVSACLDQIIGRMYSFQPNLVELRYLETFEQEIAYLISHGILVRHGSKLSFFHQSFYEYYLAGWFVESGRDLISYIFEEEQNLYIRSLIKTVIEFLREADHIMYIQLYDGIISSEKIRYHIRYLFITELGQIEEPSEKEKKMVFGLLGTTEGKLFLDVFRSPGWILFLIENELLPVDVSILYSILHRNLNFHPLTILTYLTESDIEGKENLIINLLPTISDWTSELLPYFNDYCSYNDQNELWYFEMLKKIALVDMEFVLDKLGPVILMHRKDNERLKFDYRYDRIMEHLFQIQPNAVVAFLLKIQMEILKATECRYYGIQKDVVSTLVSSRHYDNDLHDRDNADEKSIESFLIKYYRTCERAELEDLFHDYKETNYVPLLILLIKLLRDRAEEFIEEIFLLLEIIRSKNGLKGKDDFFSLNIRKLIVRVIALFSIEQYTVIKSVLLNITHPYQIYIYNDDKDKRRYSTTIGKKKYLFLKALPKDVLQNDRELREEFHVLERRYGEINHNLAMDRSRMRWGASESPLSNPNFDKFNHEAWLSSMRKINDDFKHEDFFRGDILEHGRSFESAVEKNPSKFYVFINSLFDKGDVSLRYISHGISGLIKAKDDVEKTAALIKKEILLPLNREYTQYAVWHTRFLIDHQMVTDDVVNFWMTIARWEPHNDDELNPDHPMSDFINSPRGCAVDNLIHLGNYPQYMENVFGTIEHIIRGGQVPQKTLSCGIMANIAYLNQLDIKRAFAIFRRLVMLNDLEILRYSINPAQYYNNTFHDQMDFYFKEMFLHEELHEQCYFFVSSWVFEKIDDYDMYMEFMALGEKAYKCAMAVAESFLVGDDGVNQRCLVILDKCLGQNETDLSHEFSGLVLRKFTALHFNQLLGFIEHYVLTAHFAKDPRYLFEYLTECAALYPCECLALLCKMNLPFNVDIRETAYLGDEPLILVLAIYSKLRDVKYKYKVEQEKALDEFDRMLTMPSIRIKALEAMENVLN